MVISVGHILEETAQHLVISPSHEYKIVRVLQFRKADFGGKAVDKMWDCCGLRELVLVPVVTTVITYNTLFTWRLIKLAQLSYTTYLYLSC